MNQLHTALLSNLIVLKMSDIMDDVRELVQLIEEEPDLSPGEHDVLLRAASRMLAEADVVLAWISEVPMSGLRN